jgi:hypothetical protein
MQKSVILHNQPSSTTIMDMKAPWRRKSTTSLHGEISLQEERPTITTDMTDKVTRDKAATVIARIEKVAVSL